MSVAPDPAPGTVVRWDPAPGLVATDRWSGDAVARAGIPVVDVPFVSVGGGIG